MTSGIYLITCTASHKCYVGSSKRISRRWATHKRHLVRGNHYNIHIQNSWNKNGADSFVFEIIESVSHDLLYEREIYWIEYLKPEFNLAIPNASERGWRYSEETRKRMSVASKACARYRPPPTEEHKQRIGASNSGKKHSIETRLEMSRSRKGRPGYPKSAEAHAKISKAKKGMKNSPEARSKMSVAKKGKAWTPARRAAHRTGQPAWNRGKKMTRNNPGQLRLDLP